MHLCAWSRAGGLPDAHEQRPFEEKLGIQEIEKGGTLSRSFFMAPELVEP